MITTKDIEKNFEAMLEASTNFMKAAGIEIRGRCLSENVDVIVIPIVRAQQFLDSLHEAEDGQPHMKIMLGEEVKNGK